jgi:hypothetical protein
MSFGSKVSLNNILVELNKKQDLITSENLLNISDVSGLITTLTNIQDDLEYLSLQISKVHPRISHVINNEEFTVGNSGNGAILAQSDLGSIPAGWRMVCLPTISGYRETSSGKMNYNLYISDNPSGVQGWTLIGQYTSFLNTVNHHYNSCYSSIYITQNNLIDPVFKIEAGASTTTYTDVFDYGNLVVIAYPPN